MEQIKEKIAKLLALAESPNENEARAALLKARALMAEHKLSMADITPREQIVIKQGIGIYCTKMTDQWAVRLNRVIAHHYCCASYRHQHHKGEKKVELGLIGFREDFEICRRIVHYAYNCVKSRCKEISGNAKKAGKPGKERREMCNAYGWGFCAGLIDAYDEQESAHQEWGLVLATPQQVIDVVNGMGKPKVFVNPRIQKSNEAALRQGYADGRKFDPATKLDSPEKRKAIA